MVAGLCIKIDYRLLTTKASNDDVKDEKVVQPEWSNYPITPFSGNVISIVDKLKRALTAQICGIRFNFIVSEPNTVPQIDCLNFERHEKARTTEELPENRKQILRKTDWYCKLFHWIFRPSLNRTLPHNVSLGISPADYNLGRSCVGSSGPKGSLCIPNVQEIIAHMKLPVDTPIEKQRWNYSAEQPWESRRKIPVFRGAPRLGRLARNCSNSIRLQLLSESSLKEVMKYGPKSDEMVGSTQDLGARFAAVVFSKAHPALLNARFTDISGKDEKLCLEKHRISRNQRIDKEIYYSMYQVALVLGGYGAAFRTARHFSTKTAVLMQEFEYEEWFKPKLVPFRHYIPLKENLSDLEEKLRWIRENPKKVKAIGEEGKVFYEKYLTFARNEEHMYELLYRLSEFDFASNKPVFSSKGKKPGTNGSTANNNGDANPIAESSNDGDG